MCAFASGRIAITDTAPAPGNKGAHRVAATLTSTQTADHVVSQDEPGLKPEDGRRIMAGSSLSLSLSSRTASKLEPEEDVWERDTAGVGKRREERKAHRLPDAALLGTEMLPSGSGDAP